MIALAQSNHVVMRGAPTGLIALAITSTFAPIAAVDFNAIGAAIFPSGAALILFAVSCSRPTRFAGGKYQREQPA